MTARKDYSKEQQPDDARQGDYTSTRLKKMDNAFSRAMERALQLKHATRREDDDDG